MRHTLREAWSGLRGDQARTIAVIGTRGDLGTRRGSKLNSAQQVELAQGRW